MQNFNIAFLINNKYSKKVTKLELKCLCLLIFLSSAFQDLEKNYINIQFRSNEKKKLNLTLDRVYEHHT